VSEQPSANPTPLDAEAASEANADAFLIRKIRQGDQRSWRQLIDRYQGRLLAYARSRLGRGGDAEDALQETLLGFVNSLRHYDEERSLETYLFAILRYKIQEQLTKRKRAPAVGVGFDADDDGPIGFEPATDDTPSRIADRRESTRKAARVTASILRSLIEELRDRDKLDDLQVVELLFFVGMRNKEAAERVGRDEKTVAGVKFRALGRLRSYLDEAVAGGRFDPTSVPTDSFIADDATIAQVWRRYRLSCLKRGTIGSYLLGALDEPWRTYTQFHLDTVQCLMCRANLEDLSGPEGEALDVTEQLFQSSVGFLSRSGMDESQA
jgi:RNA polymerase sigma-70 factor (ECF subfamily)